VDDVPLSLPAKTERSGRPAAGREMDALAVGEADVTLMLVAAFITCLDVVTGQGVQTAFSVMTETSSCGENGTTGINAQAADVLIKSPIIKAMKTLGKKYALSSCPPLSLVVAEEFSPESSLPAHDATPRFVHKAHSGHASMNRNNLVCFPVRIPVSRKPKQDLCEDLAFSKQRPVAPELGKPVGFRNRCQKNCHTIKRVSSTLGKRLAEKRTDPINQWPEEGASPSSGSVFSPAQRTSFRLGIMTGAKTKNFL
ncbi:MAG: hypothetical protein M1532_02285, partial [Nitrospirae bacterium]|nr:hypothetical protein [Nitrospirota bacterium]